VTPALVVGGETKALNPPPLEIRESTVRSLERKGTVNDSLGAAGALTAPLVVTGVLLRTIMRWVRIGRKGRDVRVSPSSAFGQPGGRMGRGW